MDDYTEGLIGKGKTQYYQWFIILFGSLQRTQTGTGQNRLMKN